MVSFDMARERLSGHRFLKTDMDFGGSEEDRGASREESTRN